MHRFIAGLSDDEQFLQSERNGLLKVHSEFGDDFLRNVEDAKLIINGLNAISQNLANLFITFPSLQGLFEQEFFSWKQFNDREFVLDICFLDEYIFVDKELFPLVSETDNLKTLMSRHVEYFSKWIEEHRANHLFTQNILKDKIDIDLQGTSLKCQCIQCVADYRNKIREAIFDDCLVQIEEGIKLITTCFEQGSDAARKYYDMQKELEKKMYRARNRLKKSSLNKLESLLKNKLRESFNYPSELGKKQALALKPLFTTILRGDGLRPDFLGEEEMTKFFSLLASNLWRPEGFIEKEFKKFVKSVMVFKRKDISASILKEYLGEFWVHSKARRLNRKVVYHMGPTNSGKTYHAINGLCQAKNGCYLAPLRLLAAELFDTMNNKGVKTSLLTGEEVIEIDGSTHYSSTIEMAKFQQDFECAVIDEIQMITDPQRGWAWTRALVNLCAKEIHVCGDPSVHDLIQEIVKLCGDTLEIQKYERMTELVVDNKPIVVGDLERSDALIVFSRRNALKYKFDLEQLGFKVSIVYGRLSPEVRREQARKFDVGETDIIVSTDAIAMGMNLPIQRIVFSTLTKNIDDQEFDISTSEIKQIAGRAGRYKRFPIGHVTCLTKVKDGIPQIKEAMSAVLSQQTKSMVGPDLDLFNQVNNALKVNSLPVLKLSEFLRLFNTMTFQRPFYCVDLKEMIELAEMVEDVDAKNSLTSAEVFGFACSPVNLGLVVHVEYFIWILNQFVNRLPIRNEEIDFNSNDIDYLETSIKCVELFQWLSRHFNNKNFEYEEYDLLFNKQKAIDRLNELLSDKIVPSCSSCGSPLEQDSKFSICEVCFRARRFNRRGRQQQKFYGGENPKTFAVGPHLGMQSANEAEKNKHSEIREVQNWDKKGQKENNENTPEQSRQVRHNGRHQDKNRKHHHGQHGGPGKHHGRHKKKR